MKPGLHSSCRLTCFPARLHLPLTLSAVAGPSHLPREGLGAPGLAGGPCCSQGAHRAHSPRPAGSTSPEQPCTPSAGSSARPRRHQQELQGWHPRPLNKKKSRQTPNSHNCLQSSFLTTHWSPNTTGISDAELIDTNLLRGELLLVISR